MLRRPNARRILRGILVILPLRLLVAAGIVLIEAITALVLYPILREVVYGPPDMAGLVIITWACIAAPTLLLCLFTGWKPRRDRRRSAARPEKISVK